MPNSTKIFGVLLLLSNVQLAGADVETRGSKIGLGAQHLCALVAGRVKCWGTGTAGQTAVPGDLRNPKSVSTGKNHSCALVDSGVRCWGANEKGQIDVPALVNPRQVSAGFDSTCALDDRGVHCWGEIKRVRADLLEPRWVSTGDGTACALDAEEMKCFGKFSNPEPLFGEPEPHLTRPTSIRFSVNSACATQDGQIHCWGTSSDWTRPPAGNIGAVQVSAPTLSVTCAVVRSSSASPGRAQCWGSVGPAGNPPTGLGAVEEVVTPPAPVLTQQGYACALATNGVRCWGRTERIPPGFPITGLEE